MEAADHDAVVPTCPGWSAADLLWHLAEVQYFWGSIVDRKLTTPDAHAPPERPDDMAGLFEFFDEAAALLARSLAATADDVTVWTWAADAQHVGFVKRRQAHEALIHRIDAELISAGLTPVDAQLATDGVDEALTVMYGGVPDWAEITHLGSVGRIATDDTARSWLVQLGEWRGTSPTSGTEYDHESMLRVVDTGETTWAIIGAAADLDAWFWNRPTVGEIEHEGDTAPIADIIATGLQ